MTDSRTTDPVTKWRKKPVVIDAVLITTERALNWLQGVEPVPFGLHISGSWHWEDKRLHSASIGIETLEGVMVARIGDWIIKGVKGELYPCKNDIFEATYEPA